MGPLNMRSEGNTQFEREIDTTTLGQRSTGIYGGERTMDNACF
jgi:hypothetical protein